MQSRANYDVILHQNDPIRTFEFFQEGQKSISVFKIDFRKSRKSISIYAETLRF